MARLILLVAAVAMAVGALAMAQEVTPPTATQWPRPISPNLAANGGFEQASADRSAIPGWSGDPAIYTVDTARPHTGVASLRHHNTDPSHYVLFTQPVKLQPGALYEYGAWIRTQEVNGAESGAAMCLEWSDAKGRWLGGSYGPGIKGTHDWTQMHEQVRVPANAVRFTLTCYLRKGMTGTAWFDDVTLVRMADRPMQAVVLEPNYRGRITGDIVKVRALLNWQDSDLPPGETRQVTAQLQDAAGRATTLSPPVQKSVSTSEASCDLSIPVPAALNDAALNLVVRLLDNQGKELISQSEPLVHQASPSSSVYIDTKGRTIVDGKPFFPIGFYLSQIQQDDLQLLAQSKVNCVMPYASPTRQQMDLAQKSGLRVIYSTKDWYYGTEWSPSWLKSEAQEQQAIRDRVREFRDHPALLAWYLNDELAPSHWPRLASHYRWTATEDPNHPTWSVVYQVGEIDQYLGTCDVIGTDPYPIGNVNPSTTRPSLAGQWTRSTVTGMQHARPVWMVPQVFNHAVYQGPAAGRRTPTIAEVRSMSWQCITEGATGLVYYSWFDLRKSPDVPFDEHWAKLRQVIAEIDQLSPIILADPTSDISVQSPPAWLHVLLRRHAGKSYAILANDGEGQGAVKLQIPAGHTAAILSGSSAMAQTGNSVQVELSKLDVVVIEVR